MRGGGFKSFEKQRCGSYGKRNTRSFFSGDLKEKRGKESGLLGIEEKVIPLAFGRQKPPVGLFDLSPEPFDLKPIELLGSHIHQVKQFFYVDDPIDAFIVDDHFMNTLAHLFSSPAANPQMGQALTPLTLVSIHQAIND